MRRRNQGRTNAALSVYVERKILQLLERRFNRGLILDHEALGAAQALDAIKIVVEGIGGREVVFQYQVLIVLLETRQFASIAPGPCHFEPVRCPFDTASPVRATAQGKLREKSFPAITQGPSPRWPRFLGRGYAPSK